MNFHIHKRLIITIAAVLGLLLVILCAALVYEFSQVAPAQLISREHLLRLGHQHIVLGPNDTGEIASWMTFDYINHVFDLPPSYLQSALVISDPHYPHLTLFKYATEAQTTPDALTLQVQNAVKDYFPPPVTQ